VDEKGVSNLALKLPLLSLLFLALFLFCYIITAT
jgi:hypothetical protein